MYIRGHRRASAVGTDTEQVVRERARPVLAPKLYYTTAGAAHIHQISSVLFTDGRVLGA